MLMSKQLHNLIAERKKNSSNYHWQLADIEMLLVSSCVYCNWLKSSHGIAIIGLIIL